MEREVKVVITYDKGYERRYTDSCLAILRRNREKAALAGARPETQAPQGMAAKVETCAR